MVSHLLCGSDLHCTMLILQLTLYAALYQVGVCSFFVFFPSNPPWWDFYWIYLYYLSVFPSYYFIFH